MRNPFQSLLVGSFLLLVLPAGDDGATPQTGTFGQIAPQSGDVRLVDAVPHQDDHGGTLQQLVCAAGSKAGFSLLWSDHREGMTGLYLGRYDHEGHIQEPERPIHQPYAGRRLQPGLALDAEGDGIALWTCDYLNVPVLYARSYEGSGNWRSPDQPLVAIPEQMQDPIERTRGVQLPSAAPIEGGGFAVAWTIRGALMWVEVKRDGSRRGDAQRLNPRDQQADPGVQLCGPGGKKDPIAVWRANDKLWSLSLGNPKAAAHDLGAGTLVRSIATEDGGAWILVHSEKAFTARHLRADGKPEGEAFPVCEASESALDLAVLGSKLAVLVQSEGAKPAEAPARGRGGRTQVAAAGARFQLRLIESGKSGPGIDFLSDKAKLAGTPLVASDGKRLLVAWTDSREGDPDIYARLVTPGAENPLGPEFRANTDRASADQTAYRIDANGAAGVVTWIDKRDGAPRAYGRRIAAPGSFAGDEFALTAADAGVAPGAVSPALRPDGTCGFLWADSTGTLRLALQDQSGQKLGEPRVLETEGARDAVLTLLPADTGWLCAWIGPEPAIWALRVDTKGEPASKKQRLSREAPAALGNLSACALGGRRLVLAWDTNDGGWKVRGRFAGLDGNPLGAEFELEPSPRHQDWDPALAPVGNGGFVAAWTSGAPEDGSRDVVARFFDGQGSPAGPLLWISPTHNEQDNADIARLADGTWAVGWEDDISGLDNTYVRRIQKDQRQVGPVVRINELATKSIQDRCAPHLAALTDGLLFAFGDRARSLGWDVRVRIVGPKFDAVDKH